jgi:hypothetical protein
MVPAITITTKIISPEIRPLVALVLICKFCDLGWRVIYLTVPDLIKDKNAGTNQ